MKLMELANPGAAYCVIFDCSEDVIEGGPAIDSWIPFIACIAVAAVALLTWWIAGHRR